MSQYLLKNERKTVAAFFNIKVLKTLNYYFIVLNIKLELYDVIISAMLFSYNTTLKIYFRRKFPFRKNIGKSNNAES